MERFSKGTFKRGGSKGNRGKVVCEKRRGCETWPQLVQKGGKGVKGSWGHKDRRGECTKNGGQSVSKVGLGERGGKIKQKPQIGRKLWVKKRKKTKTFEGTSRRKKKNKESKQHSSAKKSKREGKSEWGGMEKGLGEKYKRLGGKRRG